MSASQLQLHVNLSHPDLAPNGQTDVARVARLLGVIAETMAGVGEISDSGAVCSMTDGEPLAYWLLHTRDSATTSNEDN